MIPILFDKTERSFTTNGICRLPDMISCEVTEERNGIYECDFEYPVDGINYDKIQCGRIVGVIHDDSKTLQPFDIVSYTRPINGVVSFHCVHVSYRLTGCTMRATNINNIQEAVLALTNAETTFEFDYDTMRTGYMSAADGIPRSVRSFIGGVEGSMLDTYGGEIEWDKFNVMFYKNRGELKDFKIRYGLNMVDYEDEVDFSDTYNQCVPYWTDGKTTVRGNKVSSGFPTYTGRNICIPLDLSDKFEAQPTKAQLQSMGTQYMQNNQTHLPRQTIKVDFIRLQDVGEFEMFSNMLKCNLCDTIGVVFPQYGMEGTFKIVRTVYNVLSERYTEMELGTLSVSLSEALGISTDSSNKMDVASTMTSGSGSVSIASSSALSKIADLEQLEEGTYLITASVRFPANATGARACEIGINDTQYGSSYVASSSVGNYQHALETTLIFRATSNSTINLYARQSSGADMTITYVYRTIRL